MSWRESAVVGTLMNTRGLTELIVLNLALSAGAISNALFAALVIMAIVTTLMAAPLLKLLDPRNEYGANVEDEFAGDARPLAELPAGAPARSILVAPQTDGALGPADRAGAAAGAVRARPRAADRPPGRAHARRRVGRPRRAADREPAAGAGVNGRSTTPAPAWPPTGVSRPRRGLQLDRARHRPRPHHRARAGRPGADRGPAAADRRGRPARRGQRAAGAGAVRRGRPGRARGDADRARARTSRCSSRSAAPSTTGPRWSSARGWRPATGAPLKLLGAAGQTDETKSVTRMLADAGLLVQQATGIATEPLVVGRRPRGHRGRRGRTPACW